MSTQTVWSHEFVVDGRAYYVRGPVTRYEAFLLVTPIPATATWVNAFITHFPSKHTLGAEELDTAPRTQVKVNIVRRHLPPVSNAQPPPTQSPSNGGAAVVAM